MAGLLALTIAASNVGMVSADAYGIVGAPNSAFEYNLYANVLSDTRIQVVFEVVNNPGLTEMGVTLQYGENCTYTNMERTSFTYIPSPISINTENRTVFTGVGSTNTQQDNTDLFQFRYYFDVESVGETTYEFKIAISQYASLTEEINFSRIQNCDDLYETVEGYPYILGDMNDSKGIEIADATLVMDAVSASQGTNLSVDTMNWYLENEIETPIKWREKFADLICAEVADANGDTFITKEDANDILQAYSNYGASLPMDEIAPYVGEKYIKTVTVE